ncbi:MAG TPA: RNA 2',3'-cyclic phosphodiesterase [Bryobacteraceae bacterium]|nr:RNA 2',3'-cyclic phosphodiesterase [Bryobacteraceae bacterium]
MRLFVGLDLPASVKSKLSELLDRLRPAARLKWSPVSNLHLTTKFIGEWPEQKLPEMVTALQSVSVPAQGLAIGIRGLGWFPNPHHPRVLWAGVIAPPALVALARATDQATAELGVPVEERDYSPHLTLARIKDPTPLTALQQAVAKLASVDCGQFTPTAFYLYHSKTGPSGSVYTKLAEFPLQ